MIKEITTTTVKNENFSPEIDLLLCCSRTKVDSITREKIKTLIKSELNWEYFMELALQHSTILLVYQNLNNICPDKIPSQIINKLKKDFRTNSLRNLYLTRELLQIIDLFNNHNIPILCFKGPPLTKSIYGDLSLRQFSDLDLLVYDKDIVKAKNLLLDQGSKMRFHVIELNETEKDTFITSETVHKFVRESAYEFDYYQGNFIIELHWGVMPKYFAFPLETEELWQNVTTISLLNQNIPTLTPEYNLLLLCGHGNKDFWDKLSRVCDINELILTNPNLNWNFIFEQAKLRGGLYILLSGLLLANKLLQTPLPELVWQKINAESNINLIVHNAQKCLFVKPEEQPNKYQLFFYHLQTKERLQDKLWYIFSLIFTPTPSDWIFLPKANIPSILYYLIRPLRLLFVAFSKKMAKGT